MKTPQWTVKVSRKYNPDRTVVAYGESAPAVEANVIKSLREDYGIWDARAIEVIGQVKSLRG
ncbi:MULTISPECIES: hypothetical protein [unclassified Microcoleus]|uniref:hypothetical protein n=1 Tax=unclassified Microcoleus TaxID=2642155 RepID=UPI001D6AB80D|nr:MULTISPECIES: hypothetical protein [unclassified Microcoleus]MCC3503044.1 hypothetical protein [Microcoleus sp. PH2017_19_SFW_U_A]MCC3513229.1 hypothetical protein [Microcoleus sp. PH2017_17_BER_D_A]TAG43611.1 MAG: hypothetical protein EAZ33_12255 [Oscillatoriales cyanobacterium]MCC3437507.1 hypothetical protein [Microcoleus sp. PH2017_05_CCC_O_A]MCC3523544.1 hypothetical protein [Microcoleus sp. PH2017_20_SFW_D_A]